MFSDVLVCGTIWSGPDDPHLPPPLPQTPQFESAYLFSHPWVMTVYAFVLNFATRNFQFYPYLDDTNVFQQKCLTAILKGFPWLALSFLFLCLFQSLSYSHKHSFTLRSFFFHWLWIKQTRWVSSQAQRLTIDTLPGTFPKAAVCLTLSQSAFCFCMTDSGGV